MKWGPYKKLRSEYFLYGKNNCLIRALLYSHHELVPQFLESCRKSFEKIHEGHFCEKQTKNVNTKILQMVSSGQFSTETAGDSHLDKYPTILVQHFRKVIFQDTLYTVLQKYAHIGL